MTTKPKSIRKNTEIEDIAKTISEMRDFYASLYSTKKFATQYLLCSLQEKFPQYTTRSILEMIKPLKPIKEAVKNGTYKSNVIKDCELVDKLQNIINNLSK